MAWTFTADVREAALLHVVLQRLLDPAVGGMDENGYEGLLVKRQFWVGRVPEEIRSEFAAYGSIYGSTPASLEEIHSDDGTGYLAREDSQLLQVSVFSDYRSASAAAGIELFDLFRSVEKRIPLLFPSVKVLDVTPRNFLTFEEAPGEWQTVFDVELQFQS